MCIEPQKSQITKTVLKKKSKARDISLPDFKLYYTSVVIKTVCYWHKNRHIDQWNRIREHRNQAMHIRSVNLWQGAMKIQWGKDSLFSKWCWETWVATCKRMKLNLSPTSQAKINSKWIKDLNMRPEIINLLEENTGGKLLDFSLGNDFLDLTSNAKATKAKLNKWDHVTLEASAQKRKSLTKWKGSLLNGRKYLQIMYLIRSNIQNI